MASDDNTEAVRKSLESEIYTFFWRSESPFSQWHPAKFTVGDITYNCAEQYMMHQKALWFKDEITANKIMKSQNPKEQKKLGKQVPRPDTEKSLKWDSKSQDIVKKGNIAKFSQNEDLKKILLDTDGTILVEASPYDKKWGIGLAENDPRAKSKSEWEGRNLLGYILTDVREEIMKMKK